MEEEIISVFDKCSLVVKMRLRSDRLVKSRVPQRRILYWFYRSRQRMHASAENVVVTLIAVL